MKRLLFFSSVLFVCSLQAHSATLVWNADLVGNGFDEVGGTDLPAGNLIRAGFFDIPDAEISANTTTPAGMQFLNTRFTEYAVARVGQGVPNTAGHFSNIDENNTVVAGSLAGRQIYLWVFSSLDNTNDTTSFATATQTGIFYLPLTTDPDWKFAIQDPFPESTSIALRDLTVSDLTLRPEARLLAGTFGPGTSVATGDPNFTLQLIPEPSSVALLGCGLGALFARRRRLQT